MEDIEDEIKKNEIELLNKSNTEEAEQKPKQKRKGQTRERMMELHKIRSEKARLKREENEEIKKKAEEVKKIKKEILNTEYEEAKKIKEALEARKDKKPLNSQEVEIQVKKETKNLYKTASRDILKDKYLEEAKKRVMMDLFS
jgi:hypothetical protein